MALKTLVKINTVNNLSDARYCAGMMVDQIGFCLNPANKNYISPERFQEITEWISGIHIVGEFENMPAEEIIKVLPSYGLNHIQVNSLKTASELSGYNQPIMFHIDLAKTDIRGFQGVMEEAAEYAKFILVDNSEEDLDSEAMNILQQTAEQLPIILGAGFDHNNVNEIIDHYAFKGIAITGGDEIKPGLKDYDQLADILEAIEIED